MLFSPNSTRHHHAPFHPDPFRIPKDIITTLLKKNQVYSIGSPSDIFQDECIAFVRVDYLKGDCDTGLVRKTTILDPQMLVHILEVSLSKNLLVVDTSQACSLLMSNEYR